MQSVQADSLSVSGKWTVHLSYTNVYVAGQLRLNSVSISTERKREREQDRGVLTKPPPPSRPKAARPARLDGCVPALEGARKTPLRNVPVVWYGPFVQSSGSQSRHCPSRAD